MRIDRYWMDDESSGWTLSEKGDPYAGERPNPGGIEWGFNPVCSVCGWVGSFWNQRDNAIKELQDHLATEGHAQAGRG
jgi:hypothetical protein